MQDFWTINSTTNLNLSTERILVLPSLSHMNPEVVSFR